MLRVCYDKNMKDKIYDAVIIGGGPCGASAAQALAKRGVSTLVLERCALPRYKSCSGMIIAKTAQLVERYFDVCIPGVWYSSQTMAKNTNFAKAVSTCGAVNLIIGC